MNLLVLTNHDLRMGYKNTPDCDVELNHIRYNCTSLIKEAEVVLFVGKKRIKVLKNNLGHRDIVFPFGWESNDIIEFCKFKNE